MENKELTPAESLTLIANIINQAKSRFNNNGFSFIFLGICISLASLCQFILILIGKGSISYYPYFLLPIAGVITYFYYRNKLKDLPTSVNPLSMIFRWLGIIIGVNTTVLGFVFWQRMGSSLFPMMLVLTGLWCMITGIGIRFKALLYSGILINLTGYLAFFLPPVYHPLALSIVIFSGVVIPGILLNVSKKQDNV
jgi:hypothetical protein